MAAGDLVDEELGLSNTSRPGTVAKQPENHDQPMLYLFIF